MSRDDADDLVAVLLPRKVAKEVARMGEWSDAVDWVLAEACMTALDGKSDPTDVHSMLAEQGWQLHAAGELGEMFVRGDAVVCVPSGLKPRHWEWKGVVQRIMATPPTT